MCRPSLQTLFTSVAVDLLWYSVRNSAVHRKQSVVEKEISEADLEVSPMWGR